MRKWLAGGVVVAALICAVLLWRRSGPSAAAVHFGAPASAQAVTGPPAEAPLVAPVSDVTPADREAKRFNRYDKDKNGEVTRVEYLANRLKAFAKLDLDHDGKLSFDEYSVKAVSKFTTADADRDGKLGSEEFATTAVVRKARTKAVCPPGVAVAAAVPVEETEGAN